MLVHSFVCLLVLQLLMKENLDLKLTPYQVLATSGNHGQFTLSHS